MYRRRQNEYIVILMCFNYKISLFTFFIGLFFSLLLFHNKKYVLENKVTGLFFIFIALIQFMDFIFWIDIHNNLGLNKIATIIGPLLNVFQPIILYIIKIYYYRPFLNTYGIIIALLNICYFILCLYYYIKFINNNKLVTKTEKGHLKWPWIHYFSPLFYVILLAINIFYLFDIKYATTLFFITYFMLYISYKYFKYNIGELWCFFGAFIPFIMFLIIKL